MKAVPLPPLPRLRDIIKLYGLTANKKLSQNFILDLNVTDKIANAGGSLLGTTVIEVGPGPGGLTRSLLNLGAKKVIVVEKDRRFLPSLEMLQQAVGKERLVLVFDDMLEVDEADLLRLHSDVPTNIDWNGESPVRIIGNLPFSVGTQLTLKWLRQIPERQGPFKYGRAPLILLHQEEVADRIVARIGTKPYSRLSIMVQHSCVAKKIFTLPGSCFVPEPKINAGLVHIEPRLKPLAEVKSLECLEYVVKEVFNQKRKMISNSSRNLPNAEELLKEAKIDPSLRSEQLTITEYINLSNAYYDRYKKPPEGTKIRYEEESDEEVIKEKIEKKERKVVNEKQQKEQQKEEKKDDVKKEDIAALKAKTIQKTKELLKGVDLDAVLAGKAPSPALGPVIKQEDITQKKDKKEKLLPRIKFVREFPTVVKVKKPKKKAPVVRETFYEGEDVKESIKEHINKPVSFDDD